MAEEKYVLTLTRDQAITAQNALELYARLRIGQFNRITELMLDVRSVDDYCQRRDLANDLFKIVACIIFGRNDYNQPNCQKDTLHHRAWNIYTALRYQMAWHDHPEGGWGVHYDEPYPWGGEAVPECVVQQDTAATAHISNAAAAGMSIAEAKDAADAMLQMFANSHDRDRERMASDVIGVEDDQQKEK